jgi:hypothetical protein
MNTNDNNIMVLDFSSVPYPIPYESQNSSDSTYVKFGLDNLYPQALLKLFEQSAIHSSIINSKVNYIIGEGIGIEGDTYNPMVNETEKLSELVTKIVYDYEIHNYFLVKITYNKLGQVMYYHHIPAHQARWNKSKTKIYVNHNWRLYNKTVTYDRYYPMLQDNQYEQKVFLFDGYRPSEYNVYPAPPYSSLKAIATSIAIDDFNLNNIINNFSPASIITFFNGENVSAKRKEEIAEDIKKKYSGTQGGKIIVDFQTSNGKEASIRQLSDNSWADAYLNLEQSITNTILTSHSVVNQGLFGVKTAGQLGMQNELELAFQLFKNSYITVRRNEVLSALKLMFTNSAVIVNPSRIEWIEKPLFQTELDTATKEKILTINELRKLAGYDELQSGNRLLSEPAQAPAVQPTELGVEKKKSYNLTYDDYLKVEHLGSSMDEFEIIEEEYERFSKCEHDGCVTITEKFDKESDIANYIIGNDVKNLTIADIQNELAKQKVDVTQDQIQKAIDKLVKGKMITVSSNDNGITIRPNPMPSIPNTTSEIFTMFQYVKKPSLKGSAIIPTTRDFCRSILNANKLYSREDIQQMTSVFGYNIMRFAGGWYFNPETQEATKSCRHKWIPVSVRRRN